ncbi:NUDIX hydrolase [Cereibacter sediminicola]|uniref:NUDIX hydrolase n=1 Tax=Cereibacter sediminicola TaxID=2584941 RepID=UPI0011A102DB|nr:NUDIX hydrolase [Cereibacter sediminicola]
MGDGRFRMVTGNAEEAGEVRIQCGAVCWRRNGGEVQVLLITSRDTGRWVIPKGGRIAGLDDPASAAQEAWEEAGIRGAVGARALGRFTYRKLAKNAGSIACEVMVFPLEVDEMLDAFPERGQRKRKWFSPDKAALKVAEPELREILGRFDPVADAPSDELPLQDR